MPTWRTPKLKKLTKALLSIKKESDMMNFLRDVATVEELETISSRLQVAEMINKNIPYRTISTKTGVSTATITRIAHWINHGEGGYNKILNKK